MAKETRPKANLPAGKHTLSIPGISAAHNGWKVRVSCDDWTAGHVGTLDMRLIYEGREILFSAPVSGGNLAPNGQPAQFCSLSGLWPMEAVTVGQVEKAVEVKPQSIVFEFKPIRPVRASLELEAVEGPGQQEFRLL